MMAGTTLSELIVVDVPLDDTDLQGASIDDTPLSDTSLDDGPLDGAPLNDGPLNDGPLDDGEPSDRGLPSSADDNSPSRRSGSLDERDPLTEADGALADLAAMVPGDPARERLRERIICQCAPAARREAIRYRHTGESMEDLVQVATVGLIHAVDRFDPSRNIPFRHFATPTIAGELKRHFRDRGWSVRVSRRVQELHQEVSRAEPELAQRLARTPSVADLAAHLGVSEADVVAGRGGGAAYRARSLNWRVRGEDDVVELVDLLGSHDRDLEAVADRESLRQALQVLPDRLRLLVSLRFVDNLTQHQIATRIGVSQMHVSRLIARALATLRRQMTAERPLTTLRHAQEPVLHRTAR